MPSTDAIVWTAISGIIVMMLGIIGFLISNGFSSLKEQLQTLWDKLDKHQTMAENNAAAIREHQAVSVEIRAACIARHQHIDVQLQHLQQRRGEDRRYKDEQGGAV